MQKVNILLVAMDAEIHTLQNELSLKHVSLSIGPSWLKIFEVNLKSNWLVVKTGVGEINTTLALALIQTNYLIKNIIHFGVGGSISHELNIGDYLVADKVVKHDCLLLENNKVELMRCGDLHLTASEHKSPFFQTCPKLSRILEEFCLDNNLKYKIGNVASGSSFISSFEEKQKIENLTKCKMVEMEAIAAVYFSTIFNISYSFIKVCSDSFCDESSVEYVDFVTSNIENITQLLRHVDDQV